MSEESPDILTELLRRYFALEYKHALLCQRLELVSRQFSALQAEFGFKKVQNIMKEAKKSCDLSGWEEYLQVLKPGYPMGHPMCLTKTSRDLIEEAARKALDDK